MTNDVKKTAEELLEWMEDNGVSPRAQSVGYEILQKHLPIFLLNYREQCRNEAIEEIGIAIERAFGKMFHGFPKDGRILGEEPKEYTMSLCDPVLVKIFGAEQVGKWKEQDSLKSKQP